jgi:hypothetical protein
MVNANRDTLHSHIHPTTSVMTSSNRWAHFLARWGIRRSRHRVEPGIYALGHPSSDSPVLVTANYFLSFDALRSALAGFDCYIVVLDTQGINVWCAAGKGTFGTDELVHRIGMTRLDEIVDHRILILPQLGASGVSAHEVEARSEFKVEYGPIRAQDLPEFLKKGVATPEMRQVTFNIRERMILIPVELVQALLPMLVGAVILYFLGGWLAAMGAVTAVLAGVVLFPILLHWIPTPNFSTKGFILGMIVALPFALVIIAGDGDRALWQKIGRSLVYMLAMPAVTAFLTLNFTGATNFTSKSGVKREIFAYIPYMAAMFGGGLMLATVLYLLRNFSS